MEKRKSVHSFDFRGVLRGCRCSCSGVSVSCHVVQVEIVSACSLDKYERGRDRCQSWSCIDGTEERLREVVGLE